MQSLYKPEYAAKLLKVRTDGFTVQGFCRDVGICKATYYAWTREHDDFRKAAALAKSAAEAHWLQLGKDNLHNKVFKDGLYKYLTAVMFGWNEHIDANEYIKDTIKQKLDDKVVKEIEAIKAQYKKDV